MGGLNKSLTLSPIPRGWGCRVQGLGFGVLKGWCTKTNSIPLQHRVSSSFTGAQASVEADLINNFQDLESGLRV